VKNKAVRATPKGRSVEPQARNDVQALLAAARRQSGVDPRRRDLLIENLHRIQDRFGQLSAAHLAALAEAMRLSQTEVYEVASFYHHFDVVKEGAPATARVTVRVCDSIACALAGADALLERLPKILGREVRVLAAPCVGRCETAPVAVVGQNPIGQASVEAVADALRANKLACPAPKAIGYAAYRKAGGYRLLAACLAGRHRREAITKIMEDAGLRGLGGAGFPAGRKWRILAAAPAPRLMALNIDEGEPGTFKDRWYLERDPHRFVEGMLLAAWCAGVGEIYIYLRDEYAGCRALLERELANLKKNPPLK